MEKGMVDLNTVKDLLRVSEVAALMGVTEATCYRWIRSGKLKHIKVGQQIRIAPSDLEAFVGVSPTLQGPPPVEQDLLEAILEQIRTLAVDGLAEIRER